MKTCNKRFQSVLKQLCFKIAKHGFQAVFLPLSEAEKLCQLFIEFVDVFFQMLVFSHDVAALKFQSGG